ncbi:TPA: hypothetical protein RVS02_000213 [Aeromonas veronii]|nr:hypothetical protein [Aeromonas veronii]
MSGSVYKRNFFLTLERNLKQKNERETAFAREKDAFLRETAQLLNIVSIWFAESPVSCAQVDATLTVGNETLSVSDLVLSCDTRSLKIAPHSFKNDQHASGVLKVTIDNPEHSSVPSALLIHWKDKRHPDEAWMICSQGERQVFNEENFFKMIFAFAV